MLRQLKLLFSHPNIYYRTNSSGLEILSVEQNDNLQEITVRENEVDTTITIIEDDNKVVTSMVNEETGKIDTLEIDKKTNMMYSSITGKTIDFSEEIDSIQENSNNSGIVTFATAPSSGTLKTSYKKIADALGVAATLTELAALFISMVASAVPYPVLTTVGILLDTFSYTLQLISNRLQSIPNNDKKGAKVGYEKVTYTKHQAGQVFYTYKYKVTSLGTH